MLGYGPHRRNTITVTLGGRMRIACSTLGLTLALFAVACSSPQEPTSARVIPPVSASANRGVDISVSGGGIVDLSTAAVGDAHFSFHASRKADGTVDGRFQQRRER